VLLDLASGRTPTAVEVRVAALSALDKLGGAPAEESLKLALASKEPALLEAARRIQANRAPGDALAQAAAILKKGTITEQRQAIESLGLLDQKGADEQLTNLLFKMKTGKVPAALHLDVLDAAAKRSDSTVLGMIKEWDKLRAKNDPIAAWRECLEGGDARAGREIFAEKAEAACLRCHAVAKQGGDVGPDLAGVATKHDRAYLLRSIVEPGAEISPGYDNILVTLNDGNVLAGIATAEDAETLTLKSVTDGKPQTVKKSTIKDRQKLPSAMPPGLGEVLGKRALRDLVEYLATLK
jgi:quinoprotein glucose dehydrogenase